MMVKVSRLVEAQPVPLLPLQVLDPSIHLVLMVKAPLPIHQVSNLNTPVIVQTTTRVVIQGLVPEMLVDKGEEVDFGQVLLVVLQYLIVCISSALLHRCSCWWAAWIPVWKQQVSFSIGTWITIYHSYIDCLGSVGVVL